MFMESHPDLAGLEEVLDFSSNDLSQSDREQLERAGQRLRRSHQIKKQLAEKYADAVADAGHGHQYESPSTSREEFLEKSKDLTYFLRLAGAMPQTTHWNSNFMWIQNDGGFANGGVCWWHSRFQRAALYLTTYRPNEAKPTRAEADKIISSIAHRTRVVEIGGFSNFRDFASTHQDLVQKHLNTWQFTDALYFFQWINGLMGGYEVEPEKLKQLMDLIYNEVQVKKLLGYVKLQIKGVDSHAWTITDIGKLKGKDGYWFRFLDSNIPWVSLYQEYKVGQRCLYYYESNIKCVPYLQMGHDLTRCFKAIERYRNS